LSDRALSVDRVIVRTGQSPVAAFIRFVMSPSNHPDWDSFKPERREEPPADRRAFLDGLWAFALAGAMIFLIGGWLLDLTAASRTSRRMTPAAVEALYRPPATHIPAPWRLALGAVAGGALSSVLWYQTRRRQQQEADERTAARAKKRKASAPPPSDDASGASDRAER